MKASVALASSRTLSRSGVGHHRHHHVQLELPAGGAAEGDRLVVAQHAGGDLHQALAEHRIDLARHDRTARLAVGQLDLVEAAARAGGQPADVVGHVEQRGGDGPQLAVALDQRRRAGRWPRNGRPPRRRGCRSRWARSSHTRRPNSGWVLMPVPTAVPPTGNSQQGFDRARRPGRPTVPTAGPARRSPARAPAAWRRPGASGRSSECSFHAAAFSASTSPHCSRAGISRSLDRHGGGHVDRRGKHVVGALAQVDVVVRMDRLLGR